MYFSMVIAVMEYVIQFCFLIAPLLCVYIAFHFFSFYILLSFLIYHISQLYNVLAI